MINWFVSLPGVYLIAVGFRKEAPGAKFRESPPPTPVNKGVLCCLSQCCGNFCSRVGLTESGVAGTVRNILSSGLNRGRSTEQDPVPRPSPPHPTSTGAFLPGFLFYILGCCMQFHLKKDGSSKNNSKITTAQLPMFAVEEPEGRGAVTFSRPAC